MDQINAEVQEWEKGNIQVFWGEIAPCDHLVQIYENDRIFMDTLEGFAGTGLIAGESVIIIATSAHIHLLNDRLVKQGFDLEQLKSENRYITINALEALSEFMINNWPDQKLFTDFVTQLIARARGENRKIRAFGEMVALLWSQGFNGATVRLEDLWNQLQKGSFTLYCAYPRAGFTQNAQQSIQLICQSHNKVIDGQARPATEIYYKTV